MFYASLVRRYMAAFVISFLAISGVQMLKGHPVGYSATQGLIWGAISSTLYILAYYVHTRRTAACPVRNDRQG